MKSPRQILLQSHRDAEPELDRIRKRVLSSTAQASAVWARSGTEQDNRLMAILSQAWVELVWVPRRVWSGLALVWLVILVFNAADANDSRMAAEQSRSVPPEMLLTWEHEQKLIGELLAPPGPRESRTQAAPQPRSEYQTLRPIG